MVISISNQSKMKNKIKWLPLSFILLTIGTIWIGSFYFIFSRIKIPEQIVLVQEGVYKIGDVTVDVAKRQIQFKAYVAKNDSWVQHLIYLHGYKWLKEKSAIVSCARLVDLQRAIALLDRWLWDELWQRKGVSKELVDIRIKWNQNDILGKELILAQDKDKLEIWDLVFLGTHYFDPIVLENAPDVKCQKCPFFPLEKKALKEMFIRKSGKSGYKINPKLFPSPGKEVEVIIKFK